MYATRLPLCTGMDRSLLITKTVISFTHHMSSIEKRQTCLRNHCPAVPTALIKSCFSRLSRAQYFPPENSTILEIWSMSLANSDYAPKDIYKTPPGKCSFVLPSFLMACSAKKFPLASAATRNGSDICSIPVQSGIFKFSGTCYRASVTSCALEVKVQGALVFRNHAADDFKLVSSSLTYVACPLLHLSRLVHQTANLSTQFCATLTNIVDPLFGRSLEEPINFALELQLREVDILL